MLNVCIRCLRMAAVIAVIPLSAAAQGRQAALAAASRVVSATALPAPLRQSLAEAVASTFRDELRYDAAAEAFVVSGCDDTGVTADLVNLNGDDIPEVLLQAAGMCHAGMSGAQSWILVRDGAGWRASLGDRGGLVPLRSRTGGWLNLVVAGPGFCHPVWRWDGGGYAFWCNLGERGNDCDDPCPSSITLDEPEDELPPFGAGPAGGGDGEDEPGACAGCRARGGIRAQVYPARDTAMYGYVEDFFRRTHLLETTADAVAEKISLPAYVHLAAGECGQRKTAYFPAQRMVMLCYEQVDAVFRAFPASTGTVDERSAAVAYAVAFVLHHELAHALIDLLDMPLTGFARVNSRGETREEDAADQFAALAVMQVAPDAALAAGLYFIRENAVLGMGAVRLSQLEDLLVRLGVPDEHSTDIERFITLACWTYGAQPPGQRPALGAALPEARRRGCADEYRAVAAGWSRALGAQGAARGASAVPGAARLRGRWRFPSRPQPLYPPDGVAVTAAALVGTWNFQEQLGRAGSAVRCRGAGTMEVGDEGFGLIGVVGGLENCPRLFPLEEDEMKGGTSALFLTDNAVFFLIGSCAYSGVPGRDGARLSGTVRCESGTEDGRPAVVPGTWTANRL